MQPAWSHLNTVVPLARELERLGHEVRIATAASMTAAVRGRGLTAVPAGYDWDASRADEYFPGYLRARGASQAGLLVSLGGRGMVEDLLALAGTWHPDVILRDASEFGAVLAGVLLEVPVVVIGIGARPPVEWMERLYASRLSTMRQQYQLPREAERSDVTGDLWLSSFPPSFALAEPEPLNEFHVRPVVADRAEGDVPPAWLEGVGDKTVYVTLGTVFNQDLDLLSLIVRTLSIEGGLDVIATTGNNVDPEALGRLPSNVHVARYIPQSVVAPHVIAVVSHGGFNTVMGSLSVGLPVCCLPLAADHPPNASKCVELGLGTALTTWTPAWGFPIARPEEVTPAAVLDAVLPVVLDDGYRVRARAMSDEIRAMPGPAEAVARIEDLVRDR
ncbi:MAG: glycosyl transferase [Frankiales bacterium]|nr:glycosyl transferase [Frankiales bacterium]